MAKKNSDGLYRSRVLVPGGCIERRQFGPDGGTWPGLVKLRDFLVGPGTGRELIEMVVYAGLPPATPAWQEERDKKNKFVQWLRANGFMVVTKVVRRRKKAITRQTST